MISIGILAYNEAALISQMLRSLFAQHLFQIDRPELAIEIVVVSNGCTDATAEIARSTLTELTSQLNSSQVRWDVCEIEQPGKSNAWNLYVHQLSSPKAEYLFLMDADIQLLDSQTLTSIIDVLKRKSEAWVAVDRPIKDIALKQNKNLIESLSVLVSKLSGSNPREEDSAWICGQLYCAKAEKLRQIWLPTHLPMDDGFIYDMIVTDCLRSPAVPQRVILAKSASHSFEAYTQIDRLLRHEKWLILGDTLNHMVCRDLSAHDVEDVGLLIHQRNEQDPAWLSDRIQTAVQKEGWWLIPKPTVIRRLVSLQHSSFPKNVLLAPLSLIAFFIDLALAVQANFELHKGGGLGYWKK